MQILALHLQYHWHRHTMSKVQKIRAIIRSENIFSLSQRLSLGRQNKENVCPKKLY